jgi:hypothetical protein
LGRTIAESLLPVISLDARLLTGPRTIWGAGRLPAQKFKPLRKQEKFGFVLQKEALYNFRSYFYSAIAEVLVGLGLPLDSDLPKIDIKFFTTLS